MNKLELTINRQKFDARFGLGFLEKVTTEEGIDIQEVFSKIEKNGLFFIPTLIWHSVNYGLQREGKEPIEKTFILDWLDEVGIASPEVTKFAETLGKSIMIHVPETEKVGKPKAKKSS